MPMPLPTPDTIKSSTVAQESEQRARVRDLSLEEERLIESVNILRVSETEEKARIETDMATFRKEQQEERTRLSLEVTTLESRRDDALKPIKAIRKEAEERNESSKAREEAVAKREEVIKGKEERTVEELQSNIDFKQELDEREDALKSRESHVKDEEERAKESGQGLATRWATFHETVHAKNKEFEDRESAVSAREQIATTRSLELDKREADYNEKDREIKHRYAILEISTAEIYKLKNQ